MVLDLQWPVFERFTGEFAGLALGPNPVTFDASYVVPRLTVHGTATTGTVGLAGPVTVEVHSTTEGGGLLATQSAQVHPHPVTGVKHHRGVTFVMLGRRAAIIELQRHAIVVNVQNRREVHAITILAV